VSFDDFLFTLVQQYQRSNTNNSDIVDNNKNINIHYDFKIYFNMYRITNCFEEMFMNLKFIIRKYY